MEITGKTIAAFREDFNRVILELQDKYDVTISLGPITYWEERFSAKLTVKNGRDPEEIARADFDAAVWKYAHLGLSQGMYKRMFVGVDGKKYAIVGFNTKATRYPLEVIQISDGSRSRAEEGFIRELMDAYYAENLEKDRIPDE